MCTVIAMQLSDFSEAVLTTYDLRPRVHCRGGEQEVRFQWSDPEPVLPVIDGGLLKIIPWGSRDRNGPLPTTGWTWRQTVEAGSWSWAAPEPVLIPAVYGCERGVWYRITEGINGLLVQGPSGPHVYMICEPPTRYYRVMTRSDRMPWLVGEVI